MKLFKKLKNFFYKDTMVVNPLYNIYQDSNGAMACKTVSPKNVQSTYLEKHPYLNQVF